eukprot:1733176-Rhodomonas_salina.1
MVKKSAEGLWAGNLQPPGGAILLTVERKVTLRGLFGSAKSLSRNNRDPPPGTNIGRGRNQTFLSSNGSISDPQDPNTFSDI